MSKGRSRFVPTLARVRSAAAVVLASALVLVLPMAASAQSRPAPPTSDPKAIEIAGKVMTALGGETAWNNTHYLRFTFAVDREGKTVASRDHVWDKWTGRYRLDGTDKEGKKFTVLMNVNSKEGRAVKDGKPLDGDELKKALESAYGTWVNDTYWLLMPYKMMDPGVVLALDGELKEGDATWDKVRLSFEGVGLTPKDKYWAFVNRKTGLVDRWDFVLKGEKKPPSSFTWEGWKQSGKVMMANEHKSKDGTRIYFPVLEVPASLPDTTFSQF
jgi:hypothetical protein